MRTAQERKEAICWVLRRALVGDAWDNEHIMLSARMLSKICGLPLPMVFYYTRQLIQEGMIRGRICRNGEHVYSIKGEDS